jgi:hypothetical protein
MKSLPIAEGGDTVSTLSLSEEEHGRAEKMTADVLDIIIAKVSLADGKLDEETNARLLDRCLVYRRRDFRPGLEPAQEYGCDYLACQKAAGSA